MATKYTNIFYSKAIQKGIFGLEIYHLATLHLTEVESCYETLHTWHLCFSDKLRFSDKKVTVIT
jgi:hypothetical protein